MPNQLLLSGDKQEADTVSKWLRRNMCLRKTEETERGLDVIKT